MNNIFSQFNRNLTQSYGVDGRIAGQAPKAIEKGKAHQGFLERREK